MYNNLHSMFGCYDYVDYYFTNNFLLQKEIDKLKKEVKKEKENNSKLKECYYNKQLDFLELKYKFDILQDKYNNLNNNNLNNMMSADCHDNDESKSDYEEYEKI